METRSSTQMSPKIRFFFSRVFPIPFLLIGAVTCYFGWQNLERAKQSSNWPTAAGIIQHSSVEYHRSDDGGGTYHAELYYDFDVQGTTYSGDRVAFGDYGSSDASHARRIVNKYPKGKEVTVYYLPKNPEVTVLEPGQKTQVWFLPAIGLVFFLVGVAMAVYLPRTMKKLGNIRNHGPITPE